MLNHRVAFGVLAAILTSLSVTTGEAGEFHAITCIKNKTDVLISYEIQYGSQGYSSKFLAAGFEQPFLQLAGSVQPMTIKYDADLRPGAPHRVYQTFGLKSKNAAGRLCESGHIYTFEIDPATTLLKLYDSK